MEFFCYLDKIIYSDVDWTESEIEEAEKSTSSLICTDSSLLADSSSIAIYNYVFYLYNIHTFIMYSVFILFV